MGEQVVEDYVAMRLTLRRHPVALLRHLLTPEDGSAPWGRVAQADPAGATPEPGASLRPSRGCGPDHRCHPHVSARR